MTGGDKRHRSAMWAGLALATSLFAAAIGCSPSGSDGTYLGVSVEDVTVQGLGGVLVTHQTQNAGNAATGVVENDIIIAVQTPTAGGGSQFNVIETVNQLRKLLAKVEVGQQVLMEVYRPAYGTDGKPVRGAIIDGLPIVLQPVQVQGLDAVPTFLGLFVADVGFGIGVMEIATGASVGTLEVNDIITAINGASVLSMESFRNVLADVSAGSTLAIKYDRGATTGLTTGISVTSAANSDLPLEGLTVQNLTTDLATARGYNEAAGAEITGLLFDTPALTSGLSTGDVIVGLQGSQDAQEVAIANSEQLASVVAARAGQTVEIRFIRGSTPRKPLQLTLLSTAITSRVAPNIGMSIQPRPAGQPAGVLVAGVYPGGPAATAGLADNDLITAVGNVAVNTTEEFWNQIKAVFAGTDVRVEVRTITEGRVQFRSLLLTTAALPATSQPS